jgi:hypothetical protein
MTIKGVEIIGTAGIEYIDSHQIQNPFVVQSCKMARIRIDAEGMPEVIPSNHKYILKPCNHRVIDPVNYTINLKKVNILYVVNQDFLPPELIGAYLEEIKSLK